MNDDEQDKAFEAVHKKMIKLTMMIQSSAGQLMGLQQAVAPLVEIMERSKTENGYDAFIMKKLVGLTRDLGLKAIEHGQNMRRQADLIEPLLDDILKGETPT